MLFNSIDFLLFFPVVIAAYFLTPHRWRWAVLLAASYFFYGMWSVGYLALLVFTTAVDYVAGMLMGRRKTKRERRPLLIASLVANLGILFTFKYLGLFTETLNSVLAATGSPAEVAVFRVLLPVGISFYTFQSIAYTMDVYRGDIKPERHPGVFALYVSFWPQLVAGPIERAGNLLSQFREEHRFDAGLAANGIKLMAWGFFLKIVVGDRLAIFIDAIVQNPGALHGEAMLALMYVGGFHLYADFSGYTLIAIGSAQVMGFRLMHNFRQPFFSSTLGELWRRWHISLTTWFRDYLYRPLRKGPLKLGRSAAVIIVFATTGLWHGAAWKFLVWGLYTGLYLVLETATQPWRNRLWQALQDRLEPRRTGVRTAGLALAVPQMRHVLAVLWTYTVWCSGCLTFYVYSLSDAVPILRSLTQWGGGFGEMFTLPGVDPYEFWIALAAIGLMLMVDFVEQRERFTSVVARWPAPVRWALYAALVLAILIFGEFGEREFVYFQF